MKRTMIEFLGEDAVLLRGWIYLPDSPDHRPAITMAHGFAATCDHGLDAFAQRFCDAGFVVLMHDHRGFGASGGEPRGDIDPWRQIADWRRAISFLEAHPAVDGDRIGLWGTSFAGGHALVIAATDPRVKTVVAQVPTISGYEQNRRRIAPEDQARVAAAWVDDDRRNFTGHQPATHCVVSVDPSRPAVYRSSDAEAFYYRLQSRPDDWDNAVTVRSSRAASMYEPGQWVSRVSPTPLLMVVASQDTVTLTDVTLAAFERALHPKRLELISGGHFDAYTRRLPQASSAARDWFLDHLDVHPSRPSVAEKL